MNPSELHSLPLLHRIAGTRVVVVGTGEMADAKRRLVARAGGMPCSEAEAHHARLAFVAVEDEGEAAAIAERLRRRGLLVNVADRADLCDFTLPSILERGPVLVAISTGGASAGLAKHLRLRLETLLPQSLGPLARALAAARGALRARWPDAGDRRRSLDAALIEGGPLDPLTADDGERVAAWLAEGTAVPGAPKTVAFQLASEDPDDLTLRQARLLGIADTVLHDTAVPPAILARARADAARGNLTDDDPATGLTIRVYTATSSVPAPTSTK